MTKVTFSAPIEAIQGKIDKHHYVSVNSRTGRASMKNLIPPRNPRTEAQQQNRHRFALRSQAAAAWWRANKPTTERPNGTEEYQKIMREYDRQKEYGNPYTYVLARANASDGETNGLS